MVRLGHILLTLSLVGALFAAVALPWFISEVGAPGPLAVEKLVYIEQGRSVKAIAAQLKAEGIVANDMVFLADARWRKRTGDLRAGEYLFPAHISIDGIISLLQSGKTHQHQVTIPEGLTVIEIVELLNAEAALAGTVEVLPPEGSLLPETYNYSRGDTRQSIIARMQKSMQSALDALWAARAEGLPFKTPAEAVVLASVVEKETGLPQERPRVAGVFVNRLNQNIPLQSDPTVIYAVTEGKAKLARALTYADLKTVSLYNTYVVPGLPPGPIANPGRASLAATLNPEKHEYIYFVADGTGGHAFAKTLAEHNANVAQWRRVQKNSK